MSGDAPQGLRERKKRATRDAIAATARRLFAERGFDAVTVAEIAVAADVSEKTVFNHFATKEDLVFAGGEARLAQLQADIAQRPPGTSVLDVFRANSEAMLDTVAAGETEDSLVVPRIVRDSPALQERLAAGWEREADHARRRHRRGDRSGRRRPRPRGRRPHAGLDAHHDLPRHVRRAAGRRGPRAAGRPPAAPGRTRLRPARGRPRGLRSRRPGRRPRSPGRPDGLCQVLGPGG